MKIAFIGIKGLPSRGGAERVVEAIVERLKEKHDLTVYCNSRYTPEGTKIAGVMLNRIPTPQGKHLQPVSFFLLSALHALFFGNYDLVHVHNMEACFVLPLLLPRFKVIATAHGQPYRVERWGRFARLLLRLTEYFYIYLPHVRTSVSRPFAEYCEEKYKKKVHHIPNGVDINQGFMGLSRYRVSCVETQHHDLNELNEPNKPNEPNKLDKLDGLNKPDKPDELNERNDAFKL
jgi:glycosyltransferase involved in cell wall biosynthesis